MTPPGYQVDVVEIRHLRYFIAVAEELSFRQAAKRLCMSQPPLSLQIQHLEQEVGSRLFDRSQQRIALTATGRIFLEYARRILDELANAKTAVANAEAGEAGELRIGFTQSSEYLPFLSSSIARFRNLHPMVALQLREMPSGDQLDAIERREVDLTVGRKIRNRIDRRIELQKLIEQQLLVVVPASSPLAAGRSISLVALRSERFICLPRDSGTGLRQLVDSLCWDQGFAPTIVQEVRELTTAVALVAAGLGISILPHTMRFLSNPNVSYLTLADEAARVPLYLMHNSEEKSPHKSTFIDLLLEEAAAQKA